MLTNGTILALSMRDTLRSLGMWFRPFANSVHDTKYHKQCSCFAYNTNNFFPRAVHAPR